MHTRVLRQFDQIKMKVVHWVIFIFVLQTKSHCHENNVCETIQDYYTIQNNPNCEYDVVADPDADPITIIKFYGYPAETHKVITLDGYILTLFRIPNEQTSNKGPVLMQHGWMSSAAAFLGLRNHSLAFLLADAGYDVWLGNDRGSKYSEGHVNLTAYNKQYWDYSVDELGLLDVPAELGYISQVTGNKGGIVYIAHSLGGASGLIYSSSFPEQARRTLKLLILFAPVAHLSNIKSPLLRYLSPFLRPLYKLIMQNDLIRLTSQANILTSLSRSICLESPLLLERCIQLVNVLFAGPQSQIDSKTLPVVFNDIPAGASFKIFVQASDFSFGNFRQYDYSKKNFEKYGSPEPPPYEVGRIQVPVFIAHAINDWAITPQDVRNLYKNLSPAVRYEKYQIGVPNFNHYDFLYGRYAKSILYDVVLHILR